MSDFRASWLSTGGELVRLHGPGDLSNRVGGTLILGGTPEHEYEAGAWSVAVSTFVIRRSGEVRWIGNPAGARNRET